MNSTRSALWLAFVFIFFFSGEKREWNNFNLFAVDYNLI